MNLAVPQVLGHVIDVVLKDYLLDAEGLAEDFGFSVNQLLLSGVRSCPSHFLNLIIGSECKTKFGSEVLRQIPGFISYTRTTLLCDCAEFNSPCWCDEETWMLDLDASLHPHGLLIPQTDEKGRAISLLVMRDRNDAKPFVLRTRTLEVDA